MNRSLTGSRPIVVGSQSLEPNPSPAETLALPSRAGGVLYEAQPGRDLVPLKRHAAVAKDQVIPQNRAGHQLQLEVIVGRLRKCGKKEGRLGI